MYISHIHVSWVWYRNRYAQMYKQSFIMFVQSVIFADSSKFFHSRTQPNRILCHNCIQNTITNLLLLDFYLNDIYLLFLVIWPPGEQSISTVVCCLEIRVRHTGPYWHILLIQHKGTTTLIQKDPKKGTVPNNYRPITWLLVTTKIQRAQIMEEIYYS